MIAGAGLAGECSTHAISMFRGVLGWPELGPAGLEGSGFHQERSVLFEFLEASNTASAHMLRGGAHPYAPYPCLPPEVVSVFSRLAGCHQAN